MDKPTKVHIEITADGYTTTVLAGEKIITRRTHKMISRGIAEARESGDFYDDLPDHMRLASDVEDCHDTAFRAAVTLRALRDES